MTRLLVTYSVLVLLSGMSLIASYLPLGTWDVPIALTIAVAKASLVGLVFMKLSSAPASSRFAAFTGFVFIVLLVGFATADVATR